MHSPDLDTTTTPNLVALVPDDNQIMAAADLELEDIPQPDLESILNHQKPFFFFEQQHMNI
jgi:hypothetical protein